MFYNSQTNLAEMKRIYLYLVGNYRGFSAWEKQLKKTFPEAQFVCGKNDDRVFYIFEPEKIWNFILQNELWKQQIENKKIGDYWELSARATPDDWYKNY